MNIYEENLRNWKVVRTFTKEECDSIGAKYDSRRKEIQCKQCGYTRHIYIHNFKKHLVYCECNHKNKLHGDNDKWTYIRKATQEDYDRLGLQYRPFHHIYSCKLCSREVAMQPYAVEKKECVCQKDKTIQFKQYNLSNWSVVRNATLEEHNTLSLYSFKKGKFKLYKCKHCGYERFAYSKTLNRHKLLCSNCK